MCYAKPGPRCSGHAKTRLTNAYIATRSPGAGLEEFVSYQDAKNEFYTTPAGIRELESEVRDARSASDRAAAELALGVYKEKRAAQLSHYHSTMLNSPTVDAAEQKRLDEQAERGGYHQEDISSPSSLFAAAEPKLYAESATGRRSTADKWNPEISTYLDNDGTFGITNGDYQATYGASREVKLPAGSVEQIHGIASVKGSGMDGHQIEVETDDPDVWVRVERDGDSMSFSIVEADDEYSGTSGQGLDLTTDAAKAMFSAREGSENESQTPSRVRRPVRR